MRRIRGECLLASLATCGCLMVLLLFCGVGGYYYYRQASQPQVRPMVHRTPTRVVNAHGESKSGVSVHYETGGEGQPRWSVTPAQVPEGPDSSAPGTASPEPDPVVLVVAPEPGTLPAVRTAPGKVAPGSPRLPLDVPGWKVSAGGLELYALRSAVEARLGPLQPVKGSKNPWKALEFVPKRGGGQHLFFRRDGVLLAVTEAPSLEIQGETLQPGQIADLAHLRQLIPSRRENQKFDVTGPVRHAFPLNGVQVQIWIQDGKIQRLALCPAASGP